MSLVLPWDVLNVILNLIGRDWLKLLRQLDRQFYKLCCKRKTGLVFTRKDICEKTFF